MNLLNKCYDGLSSFIYNFDPVKEILNAMSDLYFNKDSYYSEENTCAMKSFAALFFNHFSLSLNRKETGGNENHGKETKHIHASAADLLHIGTGNLDWRAREASLHPAFIAICPTISHTP